MKYLKALLDKEGVKQADAKLNAQLAEKQLDKQIAQVETDILLADKAIHDAKYDTDIDFGKITKAVDNKAILAHQLEFLNSLKEELFGED